ncbi:PREDICTED: chymotrypsin-1-like [Nicrophorus vespilloides]|uniref:Chymotrypsin-1-like n=1 Tax=Nicrophorus vespilloides TaxID=110193 RepID=A0ABM1MMM6_NICVS|nr:PREDICTED: chymotrypsin-1-like [Nicrophorus vespilloides]
MIKLVFLLATLGCVFADSIDLDRRIVGGEEADEGAFPYLVSLRYKGLHACTGSILNENWILTAAHCVKNANISAMLIVAGSNKLSNGGDSYQVSKTIYNENFTSMVSNDVGVIKLITPIKFNKKVQPIQLTKENIDGGEDCVLSGWGMTSFPGNISENLRYVHLKTISVDECRQRLFPIPIIDSEVCTFTKRGEGACKTDSGGPLVANGKQIGIVSWSPPCAIGFPYVYTRVFSFLDWIKENIAN